jgi:DNA-binding transcriptional LysR family regulator
VTGPASSLVTPSIIELQDIFAALRGEVTVATSVSLCDQLRDGNLDFTLARPGATDIMLDAKLMDAEPLAVAARRDHPLLAPPEIHLEVLLKYDWIMGPDDTVLTQTVMARMAEVRLPARRRRISTSSILYTLALLNQTDAVASIAATVAESFSANPSMPFVALPINLGFSVTPFSTATRIESKLTPPRSGCPMRFGRGIR